MTPDDYTPDMASLIASEWTGDIRTVSREIVPPAPNSARIDASDPIISALIEQHDTEAIKIDGCERDTANRITWRCRTYFGRIGQKISTRYDKETSTLYIWRTP